MIRGVWNVAADFDCGCDPFFDDGFEVCDGLLAGGAIGAAAGEFWGYGDEGVVGLAPVDFYFVFGHCLKRLAREF